MVEDSASQLPSYYDRSPKDILNAVESNPGAAPRAQTVDWTYTVPTGKKATGMIQLHVRNDSITAMGLNASALCGFTPSGAAKSIFAKAVLPQGTASGQNTITFLLAGVLLAGDALTGESVSNNATAGTNVSIQEGMEATEFDA